MNERFHEFMLMLPVTLLTFHGFKNINLSNIEILLNRCPNLINLDLSDGSRIQEHTEQLNLLLTNKKINLLKCQHIFHINLLLLSIHSMSSTLISLDIRHTNIDDQQFSTLCSTLTHLTTFLFYNYRPLTESNIVRSLKLLKNTLHNFDTNIHQFIRAHSTAYSYESIIDILSTCNHINNLRISCYVSISNKYIDQILNFLFQHQPSLPLIHLEVTGKISLEQLSLILSRFTSLKYLSFKYYKFNKIQIQSKPLQPLKFEYKNEQSITQLKYALINNKFHMSNTIV
jgi:hypothetical protein